MTLGHPQLRTDVLAFVLEKAWRSEDTVIEHFCAWIEDEDGEGGRRRATREMVEDALFELVMAEELEWFGAKNNLSRPMRYRIHSSKKVKAA